MFFLVYFNLTHVFYVNINVFKKHDFDIIIFHVKKQWNNLKILSSKNLIKLIMFFSRFFNKIERNYWLTELEIACLVWIFWKICYLIEASKYNIIIYTNHSIILNIVKQIFLIIFSTNKLNFCLVQAFQYIQLFHFRIFYKLEKTHLVSDALFRLSNSAFSDDINTLNILHVNTDSESVYTVIMIELSVNFKKCLKDDYIRNYHLQKIHNMINDNDK